MDKTVKFANLTFHLTDDEGVVGVDGDGEVQFEDTIADALIQVKYLLWLLRYGALDSE